MIPVSERVSIGDPDARFYKKKNGEKSKLGYQTAFATDIKEGVITRVITIPGCNNMSDEIKKLIEKKVVEELTLDGEFSLGELISLAQGNGTILNVPMRKIREFNVYSKALFRYDYELDVYVCPEGKLLKRVCVINRNKKTLYRSDSKICSNCSNADKCTKSKSKTRNIERGNYELEWEVHQEYIKSDRYQLAKVLRGIIAEGKFFQANKLYSLNIAKHVGVTLMHAQGQMTAIVINLKKIIKVIHRKEDAKNSNNKMLRDFAAS